ncbi:uncharacterized mitochondrial protein AtMg00310-like [Rutidosis leptorrhynchoides]|uniref:uncharacterized mitochondrial protein AtMg00310-like n=1 Tax=Rutidosis leptorrhynchoides TaxID=125765 RepID=UPI003A99FE4F
MRGFLWCQRTLKKGKSKVKWKDVCLPKTEGGLGIKSLSEWNSALILTHIWRLISHKDSLWVRWIHTHKLAGRNFWNIDTQPNASWSWRKILEVRELVKGRFIHIVNNGEITSMWYDIWCDFGPLADLVSTRMIYQEGYDPSFSIKDMVLANNMNWPVSWLSRFPQLATISAPDLSSVPDAIKWRDIDGNLHDFSIHLV